MAYLEYLRERAQAPEPRQVTVFDPLPDWARFQIADEFFDEWPGCSVKFIQAGEEEKGDVLVLPFEGKTPGVLSFPIKCIAAPWVVLYGFERRRIWYLKKHKAHGLIRKALFLRRIRAGLSKARMVRPVKWGISIWKKFN